MTSVRSRRLQLSGNKWILFLAIGTLLWACSPKTAPVNKVPTKGDDKTAAKNDKNTTENGKPVRKASGRVSTVALILPLGLDHVNPGAKYSAAGLKKASLALDYYRGFKLALDSLTADGANFRILLHDSKDEAAQSRALALNPQIRTSDLIVGPVFPDGMKSFTSVPNPNKKLIVSPLSPSAPSTYNDPKLVTVIPPLQYHAIRAAEFVNDNASATKKVFILTSGYSDERVYIGHFKKAIDSLSKKKIKVIQYTVSRGNLKPLAPQLTKFSKNLVLIPSTQQNFLKVTLYSLDTLSRQYPIMLFGHPNWEKFTFLKAEQMQRLNTHITSADNVNYKSVSAATFIRSYRKAYRAEPSDYAIKAFDEGLFFGQILADNPDKLKKLDDYDFAGLHNSFKFIFKPGQGWINTHVYVLKYANFELKKVE